MTEWDKAIQKTPWIYNLDEGVRMMEEIMQAQEVDGVNNLEREIRKTVKDMLWLADAKVNEEADHDAVRSYRQGYADALRQWAKTIELRLLKKKSPTAKAAEQNK